MYFHFRGWVDSGIWVNLTWIILFPLFRKNTEIPCLRPVFSNRSFVSVRSVRLTLASMTMTVLQTTLGASYTWDSFRSVRSSISWGYVNVLCFWRSLRSRNHLPVSLLVANLLFFFCWWRYQALVLYFNFTVSLLRCHHCVPWDLRIQQGLGCLFSLLPILYREQWQNSSQVQRTPAPLWKHFSLEVRETVACGFSLWAKVDLWSG